MGPDLGHPGRRHPGQHPRGKKLRFLVDKGQKVTHYVDTTQLPADRPG
ncbi:MULTISPECIES: hypothetical protein [Streptomyces]|nr:MULTISPECIES: hypothetical protein [Streptomyces]